MTSGVQWKQILPHIGLIVLLFLYIILGATVFYFVEGPNEYMIVTEAQKLKIQREKDVIDTVQGFAERPGISKEEYEKLAYEYLDQYTGDLFEEFGSPFESQIHEKAIHWHWNLPATLLFTVTMLTTVGYGVPTPVTFSGRLFCVIYGIIGIPLMLVTIADMAKFLGNFLLGSYSKIKSWLQELRNLEQEDLLGVPLKTVFLILLLYPILAAGFITWWEGWAYEDSLYFCFISVLTVGFGDFMPRNEKFYFVTIIFVILGMIITTMCLDLVAGQCIDNVHYFGRTLSGMKSKAQFAMSLAAGKLGAMQRKYKMRGVHQLAFGIGGMAALPFSPTHSQDSIAFADDGDLQSTSAIDPPDDPLKLLLYADFNRAKSDSILNVDEFYDNIIVNSRKSSRIGVQKKRKGK